MAALVVAQASLPGCELNPTTLPPQDCRDDDPMTRGLALRSFTSLRLPNIVEYLPGAIQSGLKDQSAYVRKTAVLSCVKMHLFSPEALASSDIVNMLYAMLRDRDAQVRWREAERSARRVWEPCGGCFGCGAADLWCVAFGRWLPTASTR